jgi:U11/U12 small nuclear ribonucleoprotein 31 kDa protein
MTTKLYVGNLPTTVSHKDVRTLFIQAGEVGKITLVKDRKTQIPKGVAFVEMTTEAGQLEAIKRFDGYSMGEKPLNVRVARLRPTNLEQTE